MDLVGPLAVAGFERETRATVSAEAPMRAFGREVIAREVFPFHETHLRALEADPRDHARGVGGAAAPAIAVAAESRRERGRDLDAAAVAAGDPFARLRHGPAPSPGGARRGTAGKTCPPPPRSPPGRP